MTNIWMRAAAVAVAFTLGLDAPRQASAQHTPDLVETAVAAGTFQTLAAALDAADLVDALKGEGPFTVFAPTDEAFSRLPDGTVETLLKPENKDQLIEILKYHVVSGRAKAVDALRAETVNTLAGSTVRVALVDGALRVNDSRVTATDIEAANGVIHVIDAVLIPEPGSSARMEAVSLIELAINRGAPLYNRGQQAACASIYEVASEALLAREDLPEDARDALRHALLKASSEHDAGRRAWILRDGLDGAMSALDASMNMADAR